MGQVAAGDARLPVLILTGPTGTGKTDWAAGLAGSVPVEIVSVDSALVYRGLDIGTAKPSLDLRARIPHHLVDICDAAESYSAGRFVADVGVLIADIHRRERVPLLVGGTMLYLRSLLHGIAALPPASDVFRRTLDERATRLGWRALHAELAALDPAAAARIHCNDTQRIQRALEVCHAAGRPLSELQRATASALTGLRVRRWALVPADRRGLHARLERRFHAMMQRGFLAEVTALQRRADLTPAHPAIRAVGYRQLWAHLHGELSLDEAVSRGIAATRQLAKRQLTWIRADRELITIDPQSSGSFERWQREVRQELCQSP